MDKIKISELDLTKQTVTLGTEDDPYVSLMRGHVDGKIFDEAWRNEGWDGHFDENPTEEEIKNFEQGLIHGYAKFNKDETVLWREEKKDGCNEPVTFLEW